MAGTIEVSSVEGEGSRFEITLPLQTAAPPSFEVREREARKDGGLSPLRLLLVEDNDGNRIVGQRILQARGHDVHVAQDGSEAVEMLDRVEPDAVLMDCDMPVMDGFEATKLIRRREDRWAGVPIIALTASALESDRTRCLRAGMDGVVTKPLKLEALDAALRANVDPVALRGKR